MVIFIGCQQALANKSQGILHAKTLWISTPASCSWVLQVDLTKYVERHQFNFDDSLDESVSNEEVYCTTVKPLVHTLVRNGKATCFAYGQTGSGKTFTMSPLPIRAAVDIIQLLARPQYKDINLMVSCFEIYGNKVFDLLNQRKRLNILEDGKRQVGKQGKRFIDLIHLI